MPKAKEAISARETKTIKTTSPKKMVTETVAKKSGLNIKIIKNVPHYLKNLTSYRPNRTFYFIALAAVLLLIFTAKKDIFLAATVNGYPVNNLELLLRLNNQYRQQILNQLINEKIVLDEAKKKGVMVKNSEIEEKISQLEGNMGGKESLDSLLSQQGQTRVTLKDNIKLQLLVEKMYQEEATVSGEAVKKFVEENKEQLKATEAGEQYKEAEEYLKEQKVSEIFSQKFQELKQKANIKIF